MPAFTLSSELAVTPEAFLGTLTMAGVNAELSPIVRMTAPAGYADRKILDWPQQQTLFKSWILLFGVLPIDRHTFYFEAINAAEGFSERSTSWTNAVWCHSRTVAASGTGCMVTDTVRFSSRAPLVDRVLKPVYQWVFRLRHAKLRRRYSGELQT